MYLCFAFFWIDILTSFGYLCYRIRLHFDFSLFNIFVNIHLKTRNFQDNKNDFNKQEPIIIIKKVISNHWHNMDESVYIQ